MSLRPRTMPQPRLQTPLCPERAEHATRFLAHGRGSGILRSSVEWRIVQRAVEFVQPRLRDAKSPRWLGGKRAREFLRRGMNIAGGCREMCRQSAPMGL